MRKHLGKARYPAILVLAVVTAILWARIQFVERTRANAAMLQLLPTSNELVSALIRTGLDAEALAAAGLSAGAVNTVVANAYEHLIDVQFPLELADASAADARQQAAQLKRVIHSGRATQEQINAYPGATFQLAQAQGQQEALLSALFEAATTNLSESQRSTLATVRANRDWDVPLEFLAVNRAEAEWVDLRDCLANERIADSLEDEQPDSQAQAALAQLRDHPLVATAKASLDANLDTITAAWEQASGQ